MAHTQQFSGFNPGFLNADALLFATKTSERENFSYYDYQQDFDENLPAKSRSQLQDLDSNSNSKSPTSVTNSLSDKKIGITKRIILSTKASRNKNLATLASPQEKRVGDTMTSVEVMVSYNSGNCDRRAPLLPLDCEKNAKNIKKPHSGSYKTANANQQKMEEKPVSKNGDLDPEVNISQFSDALKSDYCAGVNEKTSKEDINEADVTQDSIFYILKSIKLGKEGTQPNKSPEISPIHTPSKLNSVKQTPTSSTRKPRLKRKKPKALEQLELDLNLPHAQRFKLKTPVFKDIKTIIEDCKFPVRSTSSNKACASPSGTEKSPIYLTWSEFISEIKGFETPRSTENQKSDMNEGSKVQTNAPEVTLIDNYVQIPLDVFKVKMHEFVESRKNSFLKLPHSRNNSGGGANVRANQANTRANHANGESDYSIVEFSVNRLPADSTYVLPMTTPEQSILAMSHLEGDDEPGLQKKQLASANNGTTAFDSEDSKPPLLVTFRALTEDSMSYNGLTSQRSEGHHLHKNEANFQDCKKESLVYKGVNQAPVGEVRVTPAKNFLPLNISEINARLKLAEKQIVSTLLRVYSTTDQIQRSECYDRLLENISQGIVNTGKIYKTDQDINVIRIELSKLRGISMNLIELERTQEEKYKTPEKSSQMRNGQVDSLKASLRQYLEEVIKISKEKLSRMEHRDLPTVSSFESWKKDSATQKLAKDNQARSQVVPQFTFSFAATALNEETNRVNSEPVNVVDDLNFTVTDEALLAIRNKLTDGELKKSSSVNQDNIGYTSFFETDNSHSNSVELRASCYKETELGYSEQVKSAYKEKYRVRFTQEGAIASPQVKQENLVNLKKEFYELAVIEKLKLEKGHPARSLIISELIDDKSLQALPKDKWKNYIIMKYKALTLKQ